MLKQLVYNYLEFLSPLGVLLAFAYAKKAGRELRHFRYLFIFFLLSCINLGFTTYLAIFTIPNLFWYNLNGFCAMLSLSVFFHDLVHRNRSKRLIKVFGVVGLLCYIALLFWNDQTTFFSSGYAVSSLLIIVYCLLFLNEVFIDTPVITRYTDQTIWVVCGLFNYYLCAYVIQVTYKFFTWQAIRNETGNQPDIGFLWGVHNVIYFLACAFIAYNLIWIKDETVLLPES